MSLLRQEQQSFLFAALCGFFAASAQMILIREILSAFSGNELLLGFALSIWLLAGAAGSRVGRVTGGFSFHACAFSLITLFLSGIYIVRSVRFFSLPGEAISLLTALAVLIPVEIPFSFLTGFIYGTLAVKHDGRRLYRYDNAGSIAGLLLTTVMILPGFPNMFIAAAAGCILLPFTLQKKIWFVLSVSVIVLAVLCNGFSLGWKYPSGTKVTYGPEGEIAFTENNDAVLLNNYVYRSRIPQPSVEQAVHIPMSLSGGKKRVLLVQDRGFSSEISKYSESEFVCLEYNPSFANKNCGYGSPESFRFTDKFDVIISGAELPDNLSSGRLFTQEFFMKMKQIMNDSGVFSFTLPFSQEYLTAEEKGIKEILMNTLGSVFRYYSIFPGEGYTFMASDMPFNLPDTVAVDAPYLKSYILPSMTPERISEVNKLSLSRKINTTDRPSLLFQSIKLYLDRFGISPLLFVLIPAVMLLVLLPLFMRSIPEISVGTTGLISGIYSIGILFLYQSNYGTLYSRIPLLMAALSLGFFAGSLIRKLPFPDLIIGVYSFSTLLLLINCDNPPLLFFMICNLGMGFLSGAQFVTRRTDQWGKLNASDLAGGVAGMAIGPAVFFPLMGVSGTAMLMLLMKLLAFAGQTRLKRVKMG
ncbi:MAG: hypothetical protein GX556_12290 [Fibrobacter sp.]|nr:hypothetical protein [Fibrobacter sp.]